MQNLAQSTLVIGAVLGVFTLPVAVLAHAALVMGQPISTRARGRRGGRPRSTRARSAIPLDGSASLIGSFAGPSH